MTWTKNKTVLSASLESALYEAKDIGSGTSGTNDYINGTILASYSLKSHQLSFLTMKTTFVEDINTALEVEKLSMFLFQDLWEINSNWSFLSRYIIGISKDIDYDYISVAPSYKFSGIKGLSSRLELAYVSSDDIDNYFQESVGILLEKSISPTLDFSADTEIGYRQRDYSVFVDSKLVFATSIFKSFTPFLTLEYLKHFSDESERNLSYQLGLRTFF